MPNWTREQTLAAFAFYCQTPFGQLHAKNPAIIKLAPQLGRTPGALAMKCVNFASMDPVQQARGIKGLGNSSKLDEQIWAEFHAEPNRISVECEEAYAQFAANAGAPQQQEEVENEIPIGPTEIWKITKVRTVQGFFRRTVISGYENSCAMCGLEVPQLLVASHIIPWSQNVDRRADPSNGLALCALHDKAFDRGLLAVGPGLDIILSNQLHSVANPALFKAAFADLAGQKLRSPARFKPDHAALELHRVTWLEGNGWPSKLHLQSTPPPTS